MGKTGLHRTWWTSAALLATVGLLLVGTTSAGAAAPPDRAPTSAEDRQAARDLAASRRDEVGTAGDFLGGDPVGDASPVNYCQGDITLWGASYTSTQVRVGHSTSCSSNPHGSNWNPGITHIIWSLDVNGDGGADYSVHYNNLFGLGARVYRLDGFVQTCTASAGWDGGSGFSATFAPSCIGNPSSFRSDAYMVWDENPFGDTCTCPYDFAPNNLGWSGPIVRSDPPVPVGDGPGAASRAPGVIDVFARGQDDALWTRSFNGSWSGWSSLGGIIIGAPAAASDGSGTLDVFVRGQDNALWTQRFDGFGWSGWRSLGGILTGPPGVASAGPGHLQVFVAGADRALYTMYRSAGGWSGWSNLGGIISGTPAATSMTAGSLSVFVRGQDNALHGRSYFGGWSGWTSFGGQLTTSPGATSIGEGSAEVFARGGDNALWRFSVQAFNPVGWSSLGGIIASPPAPVSPAQGEMSVFARGQDSALWYLPYAGGSFGGWSSLGGIIR